MSILEVTQKANIVGIEEQVTILNVGEYTGFSGQYDDLLNKPSFDLKSIQTSNLQDGDLLQYDSTSGEFNNVGAETFNVTKATLNKTFTSNETATITTAQMTDIPIVSATKEQASETVNDSTWNVNVDGNNYDTKDYAYDDTITPSATSGDITLTLGVGTWSANDVGKRIVGNGGEAILTATDGSATVTSDFVDTSTIASGLWTLYGVVFNNGSIEIGNISEITIDLSSGSYDNISKSITTEQSNPFGIELVNNGTKMYVIGVTNSSAYQYTLSSSNDLTTATYDNKNFDFSSEDTNLQSIKLSSDGTKLFILGITTTNTIYQYTLSTPYDISTATYDSKSFDVSQVSVGGGFDIGDNGDTMIVCCQTNNTIYQYTLSTPYDISTASYDNKSYSIGYALYECSFSKDGSSAYVLGSYDEVREYTLSTPYDISTATYSTFIDVYPQDVDPKSFVFSENGLKMYLMGRSTDTVYQYTVGTTSSLATSNQHIPAITNSLGQIDTSLWLDINSMTSSDILDGGEVLYAISTDNQITFQVTQTGQTPRSIARYNVDTWEYNSNETYGSETWTVATTNDKLSTLAEAMSVTANKMTGSQLDAIQDSEHFTLGDTLDLAIILYTSDSTKVPSSNGAIVNYDSMAEDVGAVHGTDYEWKKTSGTNVNFTALTAGNYKVRII